MDYLISCKTRVYKRAFVYFCFDKGLNIVTLSMPVFMLHMNEFYFISFTFWDFNQFTKIYFIPLDENRLKIYNSNCEYIKLQ